MTAYEDAARRALDYVSEYGPILNVVAKPRPKCGTCGQRSPISVHCLYVVWLDCGHAAPLPPLPVLRYRQSAHS